MSLPVEKAAITTHILNLESGRPAADVQAYLYGPDSSEPIASARTDADGRVMQWDTPVELQPGIYKLQFAIGDWFARQERDSFYPEIKIAFRVANTREHYHVPLLLNAHGYSTYRGS